MKKTVLGVAVDDISLKETIDYVVANSPKLIFTTGSEFIVTAQDDREFKKILNNADLNIPDGIGLRIFAGFKNSFAGVDLVLELCKLAVTKKWVVGIVGEREGTEALIKKSLEEKFPGIQIIFDPQKPVDLIFVAYGHPKQEKYLAKLRATGHEPQAFRIGMGVGGSFDFIAGILPRPPKLIRDIGLGWLWRGFTKPGHWRRIFRATIIFPLLILKSRSML